MALRWCAAGMVETGKQVRRVNGHLHLTRTQTAGHNHQALRRSRSDGAFMDVAPTRACVVLQWAGDGVVGFFVVGFGVLVW
jgi:hypothetical protein